jgi:hypothetical protein
VVLNVAMGLRAGQLAERRDRSTSAATALREGNALQDTEHQLSGNDHRGPCPAKCLGIADQHYGKRAGRELRVYLPLAAQGCRSFNSSFVPRYLAQFEYHFNRRYDLAAMIPRLTWAAVRTTPMSYRLLKLPEVYA